MTQQNLGRLRLEEKRIRMRQVRIKFPLAPLNTVNVFLGAKAFCNE